MKSRGTRARGAENCFRRPTASRRSKRGQTGEQAGTPRRTAVGDEDRRRKAWRYRIPQTLWPSASTGWSTREPKGFRDMLPSLRLRHQRSIRWRDLKSPRSGVARGFCQMPQEIELKLALDPRDVPLLRKSPTLNRIGPGKATRKRIITTYYDTPSLSLLHNAIALRVRKRSLRASSADQKTRTGWLRRQADANPVCGVAGIFDPFLRFSPVFWRSTCNSASLMVPFRPSSNRSLNMAG